MARQRSISNDPTHQMDINVVSNSPHVVAYRIWHAPPGSSTWTVITEGHTADQKSDHHAEGPFEDGGRLYYWLGIGGKAKSAFTAAVIFSQNGRIVDGGMCDESGKTDDEGAAIRETEVFLT